MNPDLRDESSLSNPHEVQVKHLLWEITVNFDRKRLEGTATYELERKVGNVLALDTNHLEIVAVTDQDGNKLSWKLHKSPAPHLGRQLAITLQESTASVQIAYRTTPTATACQWLPPSQTAGKKHPYLFTQCQAIHARSLLPCQDMPGVKMTYAARVIVPSWATCVLSAVLQSSNTMEGSTLYQWEQKVPISSYLLAMAVGDLERREVSPRCAIWSEPALVEAAAYEFAQTEDFLKTAEDIAGKEYVWGRYDLLCLPPSFPYGGMENPCLTFVTPTLLAGDRSLADVVAHEIAHSWTGNLVTNATWDHFWLNEGWTTWFQRKIMARIHGDDKFLDFDAIGGYKTLQDTVNREMPEDFQKLVLKIGTNDPDDSYSSIAYEKGFNLLLYLERTVGTKEFEAFFQAYIAEFAYKTLTSNDFRDYFLKHFPGTQVDWETWFYEPGMPPIVPVFDKTLSEASERLAECWVAVDREGRMIPTTSIDSWSSNQITCFLDKLQSLTQDQPLQLSTLKAMDTAYSFASSKNAEILFRYCQIEVASEDESILPVVLHFVMAQGRMKFTRPLYRALFASKMGRDLAIQAFVQNRDFYHPICAKMVASDLQVDRKKVTLQPWMVAAVVAGVSAVVGTVLLRRSK